MVDRDPALFDTDQGETYKSVLMRPDWENYAAFDPDCRWTWREEKATRRLIDWKIMVGPRIGGGLIVDLGVCYVSRT